MISLQSFVAPPSPCGYLPDQTWSLAYEWCVDVSTTEYRDRMAQGWRRFGHMLFRPRCRACNQCQPIRVVVDRFRPNRSQRRAAHVNQGEVRLVVRQPSVTAAKLRLYDRFHAFQTEAKEWPSHAPKDPEDYRQSFVDNPFPTAEWCYYLGDKLVGVGYVDILPECLSAIYFYYDPDERHRSLGTWNVLAVLAEAKLRGLPHLYLGYYVEGCRSLEYKANYAPNEVLGPDGRWRPFRE